MSAAPVFEIKNTARLGRRFYRRACKRFQSGGSDLMHTPRLFSNSFPKSGTHWLTQVMQGLPAVSSAVDSGLSAVITFEGDSGRERPDAEILRDLNRFLPGDTGYGHLHARPAIMERLTQPDWCTFFILRDPRDIVVSHVFYVTEMEPNHVHHDYYAHTLHTFDERLRTSILGRPDVDHPFPNIRERFLPYLGWMNQSSVLSLRYEEAIAHPQQTIGSILDHAVSRGLVLTCPRDLAVDKLLSGMDPSRSPTFRQGKSGGWRTHFTPEMTQVFKDTTGDLLVQLGYEKDLNWE